MINGLGHSPSYHLLNKQLNPSESTDGLKNDAKNTDDATISVEKVETKDTESGSNEKIETEADPEVQREIQELTAIENKVIAHEQAHMAAGGQFTGGASYGYTMGPDGRRYITSGEVSISIPSADDPEEKRMLLERVRQAALAPANPSPQDIKVASNAASQMGKVNSEIALKKAEEAYGKDSEPVQIDKISEDILSPPESPKDNDYKPFSIRV